MAGTGLENKLNEISQVQRDKNHIFTSFFSYFRIKTIYNMNIVVGLFGREREKANDGDELYYVHVWRWHNETH
jgi:hypothetical protein